MSSIIDKGCKPLDESPAYPVLLISTLPSPSASNSIVCQPPMNTPRDDSPAETTCSRIPSPSKSIVIIEVGIDQGCNSKVDTPLILVELIVLRVILPSTVEVFPSESPGFGFIKSKSPSLSKSTIVEFSKSIWPWKEVKSHLLPSLILKAYPWSLRPMTSISPSPSRSVSISLIMMSSNFVIGPPQRPLKSCQRVQCPVWSLIRTDVFPVPKKSPTYSDVRPAGIPAEPFISIDWLAT